MTSVVATRTGARSARVVMASDLALPVYYCWDDGWLVKTTRVAFWDVDLGRRTYADIDVFDDAEDVPSTGYGSTVVIQWESVEGAKHYEVDRWVSGAWALQVRIREAGQWMFAWTSGPLADGGTERFRVRAIGEKAGGEYREFSFFVVRRPDNPTARAVATLAEGTLTIGD